MGREQGDKVRKRRDGEGGEKDGTKGGGGGQSGEEKGREK